VSDNVVDLDSRRKPGPPPDGTALELTCLCGCQRMLVFVVLGCVMPRVQCANCATVLFGPILSGVP
jgi:hypothetical protein